MRVIFALLLATSPAFGQTPSTAPAFEVASIRVNPGPWRELRGFNFAGPNLRLTGYSLFDLIADAFNLKNYELVLPETFVKSGTIGTVYDILAKAEGDGARTRAEFSQMMRALLVTRFNFKFHREPKEVSVYAMTVGKGGPKFKESDPATPGGSSIGVNGRNQYIKATQETMEALAVHLPNVAVGLDHPIIDRTGLKGKYDIQLEATPELRINNNPQPTDISIFTAIQETLGLKLEPSKAVIQVLMVDNIEKPTEN